MLERGAEVTLPAAPLEELLPLAARLGQVALCPKCPEGYKRATWQHSAAAALHGWSLHDASCPLRLAEQDYLAALRAAEEPDALGRYTPHGPALSPYRKG